LLLASDKKRVYSCTTLIELTVIDTLLALLPLLIGIGIFYWQLNKATELTTAGARMVLQLAAIGYLLTFLFEYDQDWIGLLVLTFMLMVAAWIGIRPQIKKCSRTYALALVSIFIGGGLNLAWILLVVLELDPWYQPRMVIPLAGMVFSVAMNSISVAIERFEHELINNPENAQRAAINAATISHVNTLLAVGLVSLPGMMTGQILSGTSPLIAVRYQIMVMSMLVGTSTLVLCIYFYLRKKLIRTGGGG
jgi:putative ABC transport system permease protein